MGIYLGEQALSMYVGGIMSKPEEDITITASTNTIEVTPPDGTTFNKVTVHPTPTEEKTVTPTTEDLIAVPTEGNQLSQVTVQGDENFLEENIAEGVTIWGKTGTHKGGSNSGQYVWQKKYMKDIVAETITTVTVQLVNCDSQYGNKSCVIEYSNEPPVYNYEKKTWEMINSQVVTLLNTDAEIPQINGTVYMRDIKSPTSWELIDQFKVSTMFEDGTYNKWATGSAIYSVEIDDINIEYVADNSEEKYPRHGWVDGVCYDSMEIPKKRNVKIIHSFRDLQNVYDYRVQYYQMLPGLESRFSTFNTSDESEAIQDVACGTYITFSSNVNEVTDRIGQNIANHLGSTKMVFVNNSESELEIYIRVDSSI